MNITLSSDLAQLQLSPPIIRNAEKVASSEATDAEGNPFMIRIETILSESLHDAKNRSYVDIALADDAALNTFQQLDAHILDKVYENHDSKTWFGKRAPRDIIAGYCKTLVTGNTKTPHPFVRCKAGYSEGKPAVPILTASEEHPDDATSTTATSFGELKGERVVYEIQLTGIRFCPTTFNPELKLLRVHTFMNPGDYNLFEQLLNNANHSESKARILERQQRMEQFEAERRQLEELQAEVETEVSAAIAKREDIAAKYKGVVEAIESARLDCEMGVGGDADSMLVGEESKTDGVHDVGAEHTDTPREVDGVQPEVRLILREQASDAAGIVPGKEVRFENELTLTQITDEELMQT